MPDDYERDKGRPGEFEPKPYGKISLTHNRSMRVVTSHDRFTDGMYTGNLTCLMTALTPIHVGSGIYEMIEDNPVRGLITIADKPVVPGTSLKGMIRSVAEAISSSCVRITNKIIAANLSVRDAQPCREVRSKHRGGQRDREAELCVSCSIFGSLGYQGRVSFTDAQLLSGSTSVHHMTSAFRPRAESPVYQDAYEKYDGRKFYYHGQPVDSERGEPYQVINKNSVLRYVMNFENLTAQEFCLVLVATGILDNIRIKIGGGKHMMLGSARILPQRLELRNAAVSFEDLSAGVQVIEENLHDYLLDHLEEAAGLVNEQAVNELMKIWEYPSSRKAPTGLY
jgi:CRISPR/Cas system CSM-associated protein Csm3 (group 7 of RAMP superfamily)